MRSRNSESGHLEVSELEIYPNPTNDMISLQANGTGLYSIVITTLGGQLVDRVEMEGTSHQINLSSFRKGVYLITIRSNDFITTKRIIRL